jgi:hypothetical protein
VHAVLKPEEAESLPSKIRESVFSEGEKEYFRLPCKYFTGKCSIYEGHKADVCGSYRCQLLRDVEGHKVSHSEAMTIVREASAMRGEITELYRRFSGNSGTIHFMEILFSLGRYLKETAGNEIQDIDYEILQARCNIFEALLIKYFRSANDFEKMIMR